MRGYWLLFVVILIATARVITGELSSQGELEEVAKQLGDGKSPITISGTVAEDPDYRDRNTKIVLQPETLIEHGRIIIDAPRNATYSVGDHIVVQGVLSKPSSFKSKNGSVFDYAGYLSKDDIYYEIKSPVYVKLTGERLDSLAVSLLQIKYSFSEAVHKVLREPHASFALGILIGGKGALGDELLGAFRSTGLVHMIVLSGYNVSIIVAFVILLIPNLGKFVKVSLGVLTISVFAIFVGGGATVIRASIMAACGLGSEFFGIKYNVLKALILAGAIMVIYNPKIFLNDPSFHLSFLATLSIVLFSEPLATLLSKIIARLPGWFSNSMGCYIDGKSWLGSLICTTLAAQILTAPYIAYSMRALPIFGLVANVLVTPITSGLMLSVFVLGMLAIILGPVNWLVTVISTVNYSVIQYVFLIVKWISSWPNSSVEISSYTKTQVFITYALIFSTYWIYSRLSKRRQQNDPVELSN